MWSKTKTDKSILVLRHRESDIGKVIQPVKILLQQYPKIFLRPAYTGEHF